MTLAPVAPSVGIRRHHTAPGDDGYQDISWSRRTARITDYRTGEAAFEQADVEFPESWSQNATNIVAQKYFRGTLGTDEREWSLRQVIDRVADTVTAWGAGSGRSSAARASAMPACAAAASSARPRGMSCAMPCPARRRSPARN